MRFNAKEKKKSSNEQVVAVKNKSSKSFTSSSEESSLETSLESNLMDPPKKGIGSAKDIRETNRINKRMKRQHEKDMKHRDMSRHNALEGKKVKYDLETGKELSDEGREYYEDHPTLALEKAKQILFGRNTTTGRPENDQHLSNFIERQKPESFSYSIEFEAYNPKLKRDGLKITNDDYAVTAINQLLDRIREKGGPHSTIEIVPNVFFIDEGVDQDLMKDLLWKRGQEIKKRILEKSKLDPRRIAINISKSTYDQTTDVTFNLMY